MTAPDTSWIPIGDVKTELRFGAGTQDDAELQRKIDAAAAVIEGIKGHVGSLPVAGELTTVQRLGLVFVTERPVVNVTTVKLLAGDGTSTVLAKRDPAGGVMTGWELRSLGGVVSVPLCANGYPTINEDSTLSVDYTAGRDPVPANYVEAAIKLSAHLWRKSHDDSQGRMGDGGDDEEWPNRGTIGAYALPFEVRELLGLYGSAVKSQVLIR
jgi:hypothetical protein